MSATSNRDSFSVTPCQGFEKSGDDRFPEFRSAALRALLHRASGAGQRPHLSSQREISQFKEAPPMGCRRCRMRPPARLPNAREAKTKSTIPTDLAKSTRRVRRNKARSAAKRNSGYDPKTIEPLKGATDRLSTTHGFALDEIHRGIHAIVTWLSRKCDGPISI